MLRGDRLKALRLQKRYTHAEMAEKLDLGVRQVARYESGNTDPSGEIVARIAEVLETTTDYLLGRTDNPKSAITVRVDNLSELEVEVISALRRNEPMEAIKAIADKAMVN